MAGYITNGLPNKVLVRVYRLLRKVFGRKRVYWHDYIYWFWRNLPSIAQYVLPFRCREDELVCGLDGRLVIDIGAGTGYYTRRFAERFGRVIAFEPSARNYRLLLERTQKYRNIEVYKVAIGDRARIQHFYPRGHYEHSLIRTIRNSSYSHISTAITLPLSLLFPSTRIDLVKVDIEGYETQALDGASSIAHNIKAWLIEVHGDTTESFTQRRDYVLRWLRNHEYRIRWLDAAHVYAWRRLCNLHSTI